MDRRGRPVKLTDDLKLLIAQIQMWRKKKLKAPVIQKLIRERLKKHVRNRVATEGLRWSEDLIEEEVENLLPGLNTIRTYLNEIDIDQHRPIDSPWHMGTLKEHPLLIEAIPVVLSVLNSPEISYTVTIRQALWISRLYTVVKQPELLHKIAWHYAFNERINEISKTDFNTLEYDRRLSNPKELLEYFANLIPTADYVTYGKAFLQVTNGVKYMGPAIPVDHILIRGDKVYAPVKIRGQAAQIELPYPNRNTLLEAIRGYTKSTRELKTGETVVRLKETIALAFENQASNEFLHNLIMEGE